MDRQLPGGTFLTGDAGHSRQTPSGIWVTEAASEPVMSEKFWLPHKEVWTKQPQIPVGIDRTNLYGKSIVGAALPMNGNVLNPVSGNLKLGNSNLKNTFGIGIKYFIDTFSEFDFPSLTSALNNNALFFRGKITSSSPAVIMSSSRIPWYGISIWYDGVGVYAKASSNTTVSTATIATIAVEEDVLIYAWRTATEIGISCKGVSATASVVGNTDQVNNVIIIGSTTSCALGVRFSSVFPAINELFDNPWQIFEPKTRRIWVPNAGIPANNGHWITEKKVRNAQPTQKMNIHPDWRSRVKAFYNFSGGSPDWGINLATGKNGATIVGTGHKVYRDRIETSGVASEYIDLSLHGYTLKAPFVVLAGFNRIGITGIVWAAMDRNDDTWQGFYSSSNGNFRSCSTGSILDGAAVVGTAPNVNSHGLIYMAGSCDNATTSLRGVRAQGNVGYDNAYTDPWSGGKSFGTIGLGGVIRGGAASDNWSQTQFSHFVVIDGLVSDKILKSLAENPWQLLQPQERRIWVPTKPTPRVKGYWL